MMQGDSYCLGIELLNNAGSHIAPENVADVEITVGRVSKSLQRGRSDSRTTHGSTRCPSRRAWQ